MSAISAARKLVREGRRRLRSMRARNSGEADDGEDDLPSFDVVGSAGQKRKLDAVAEILGCSPSAAAKLILTRALSAAPNVPRSHYLLPDVAIESLDRLGDDLLRLTLTNKRVFFGQRSNRKEYLLHQLFAGQLPQVVDGDAYKLAMDVQRRYFATALPWYCSAGGTFVEGGCFTGMKAVRWHDVSPKPLRILAVEIGQTNFEILCANIAANGLAAAITPVHAGLWHMSGEGVQRHNFSTRRFLEQTDRWQDQMRHEEAVRLLTLDDLLDENEVRVADYVNIQVNGAEIHVLEGLKDIDRVKVLGVAAYYGQDGEPNAGKVREMLLAKRCSILSESAQGRVTVVTPKFRDEIMALRRGR
jgi:FkbM family methyltransferase